jgi:hypothetical protein
VRPVVRISRCHSGNLQNDPQPYGVATVLSFIIGSQGARARRPWRQHP